jgi:hypothetical protein
VSERMEARIDATAALLLESAREAGMALSGDARVGADDAAQLLGWSAGTLANARAEGRGPPSYRAGIRGSKCSYKLYDLAAWIEAQRDGW